MLALANSVCLLALLGSDRRVLSLLLVQDDCVVLSVLCCIYLELDGNIREHQILHTSDNVTLG